MTRAKANDNLPNMHIQLHAPKFAELHIPNGFLKNDPACAALFYYAVLVKKQIQYIKDQIVFEDDPWPEHNGFNPLELMRGISILYQVTPEAMLKMWKFVDMQCVVMGSPKVPPPYRLDTIPEIKTQ